MFFFNKTLISNLKANFGSLSKSMYSQKKMFIFLFCGLLAQITWAQYANSTLSTGTTAKNGNLAPAGYTWSEVQNDAGNTTESNTSAGYSGSYTTTTDFRIADNFTVPANTTWNVTDITVFGYQTGVSTFPIDAMRIAIYDGDPSLPTSNVVFGDLSTNRLNGSLSGEAMMYRLFNSTTPAPGSATGTTRKIWKFVADVSTSLPAGTYWIVYQVHAINNGVIFFPASTVPNTRGLSCWDAKQFTAGSWINVMDAGNPVTAPDVAQDFPFIINGTNVPSFTYACIPLTCPPANAIPTISASTYSPCGGTTFTLTAVPPSGYTGLEYLWSKNGTPIYYQNGGSGTYTANAGTVAASNDYTVEVVYSSFNCFSPISATATVVTDAPDATITPNGPTTFCANNPTTLTATAGMNSYVWKRSTAIVAIGSPSYTPTLSGNHSVTVTNANGCSKTSLWTNVTVRPLPTANAGADKIACLGSTVQIGGANNTANSYAWSPTTGLSNPAISNPMASPTSMTNYTVTVTNNTTGCSKSDAVLVTVNAIPPTPTITGVTSGTNAILTVSSVSANSVNWYKNGTLYLSNKPANGSITVPLSNPAYAYTVRSKGENGCLSSASNFVTARNGNDKDGDLIIALENNLMTAYPNPTTGNLQVEIQNTEIGNGTLYLYNSLGQMVFSQNVELVEGSAKLSLDLTNVASGVYSLSFEKEVVKVIKE